MAAVRWLNHHPRLLVLLGLACLAAVGGALVAQHVYGVKPCPWCILQRALFIVISAVCLLGGGLALLLRSPAREVAVRVVAVPLVLLSVSGLVAATYQHEVAAQSESCAMGAADRIIQFFDLEERFPAVFMITANCNEAGAYRLLGLPYEIWSGLLFALCLAIGLSWLLRRPQP
ncbi:disulfide bond formation protein B [Inhella sp.]|uniref:disulfide bond formation protein B n=1 Tax=Inhella sp. TaxID=1921806 RepID=UPI0035AFBEE3